MGNGFGITSMIIGILSLAVNLLLVTLIGVAATLGHSNVLASITSIGVFIIIVNIIGIILGIIGIIKNDSKVSSIVGLVLNGFSLTLIIFAFSI